MAKRKQPTLSLSTQNLNFIESNLMNDATYFDYVDRFKKLALSIFEWVNLPETMDERYLELCLYYDGQAALLKSDKYGFINTRVSSNGYINIYGLPTSLHCYSHAFNEDRKIFTGKKPNFRKEYKKEDFENNNAILVMNNWDRTPTEGALALYAQRLTEAERSSDTNVKAMKTPLLVLVPENQRLTMENVYAKYDGNQPVIFGDKQQMGNQDLVKSINTEAPIVFDKLQEYKKQIFNEALTYLGINNINVEKAERLISAEASSNNEIINLNLQAALIPRQKAAEQFNRLFGLTGDKAIQVRVRSDLHNIIKNAQSIVNDFQDLNEIDNLKVTNEEGGDK